MEAEVLEEDDLAGLERGTGGFGRGADTVGQERHRFLEQLGEFVGDRLERELRDDLAVRAAEVAGEDDRGALFEGELDGREGRNDAGVVGDGTSGLVLRDVEVHADEDAFAGEVEVADGFELGHKLKGVRTGNKRRSRRTSGQLRRKTEGLKLSRVSIQPFAKT